MVRLGACATALVLTGYGAVYTVTAFLVFSGTTAECVRAGGALARMDLGSTVRAVGSRAARRTRDEQCPRVPANQSDASRLRARRHIARV